MRKFMLLIGAMLAIGGCSDSSTQHIEKQGSTVHKVTPTTPNPKYKQQEEPPEHKVFLDAAALTDHYSFADRSGKYLIAFSGSRDTKLNKAIGEGGRVLDVKFIRQQSRSDKDDGRQWANNFDNLEGMIFEVVEGQALPDQTYYLVNDRELNLKAIIPVTTKLKDAVEDSVKQAIEREKSLPIEKIWEIGQVGTDHQIYLVQFKKKDKKVTASIILKHGQLLAAKDYVADYDPNSTWRVDDGGEVTPEMFSFLFAASTKNGLLLGMEWAGAEGKNAFFLNQKGNAALEELKIKGGRYMSP
ncbi:hypothetical protein EJP77_13925 [Paenibacillus zeisoli]|uniref:Uncharacterized protein n=1 Tax=Paenibacillus zeisoli TaxID=2496267 RepID=A0A3S1BRU5_9BACL|nr:hypothetical protein [Paenibacillus zeisoli]RUT29906.1 hypothetical protein EJP77_13925 [Paenibacillus zeisoli]